jgi:hypothetical protein
MGLYRAGVDLYCAGFALCGIVRAWIAGAWVVRALHCILRAWVVRALHWAGLGCAGLDRTALCGLGLYGRAWIVRALSRILQYYNIATLIKPTADISPPLSGRRWLAISSSCRSSRHSKLTGTSGFPASTRRELHVLLICEAGISINGKRAVVAARLLSCELYILLPHRAHVWNGAYLCCHGLSLAYCFVNISHWKGLSICYSISDYSCPAGKLSDRYQDILGEGYPDIGLKSSTASNP